VDQETDKQTDIQTELITIFALVYTCFIYLKASLLIVATSSP